MASSDRRAYARELYRTTPSVQKGVKRSNRERVQRNQRWLMAYLSDKVCTDCSEEDSLVLEFDHVRGEKKQHVAHMIGRAYGIKTIEEEIAKCELVCANCHRRRTIKRLGWGRGNIDWAASWVA